jgi:SAM-dependent methyltransferase
VDFVLSKGVGCVCVLDISGAALAKAQARLGENARRVTWIEADVTGDWHVPSVDIWHDRAVFHFLTNADDRVRYVAHLRTALRPGGSAIIATFAPDGPEKCSGLPCVRYCPDYAGI